MNLTFNDVYFNEYTAFLSLKNKMTTVRMNQYKFKNHILPYFGDKKIDEIDKKDYINFQLKLKELNYSDKFYEHIHGIINNFFKYLNMQYGIENIPQIVGRIKSDTYPKNKQKKSYWTKAIFKKFIRCVDDRVYHALFYTFFITGCRKGELLALQVSDLNKFNLNICKSITKELYNGKRQLLTPKTGNSIRNVRISLLLYLELKLLTRYYKKNYSEFNDNFFLFGGDKPISYTTLKRKFDNYCEKAKVERIRIHDLRHSHASYLFKKKIPIDVISKRLGHSSISITLDTYIHSSKKEEKRLIKKINLIHL